MAKTSQFLFTNTTDSTVDVTPKALSLVSNYGYKESTDSTVGHNATTPVDAEEIVSFRSREIARIDTSLKIVNPAPVKGGIQYTFQEEAILVTTDDEDPTFRVDEPIVVTLSIRHPKSGNFTDPIVDEIVNRCYSSTRTNSGQARYSMLMKHVTKPTVD